MKPLEIRLYRGSDRDQLRRLSYATGYMGESPAFYWRHRESFAEIWTRYYIEQEPESLFIAAEGDRVLGYLSGCVDTSRAPSPAEAVIRNMLRYGLMLRPGTAGFFWRSTLDTLRMGVPTGELDDPHWPAHLHINLLPEARGRGGGGGLMQAWFEQLRTLGVPGCHLGTLAENHRAIAFFEHSGFRRHGEPTRAPGMRTPEGAPIHLQMMVIDLAG